MPDAVQVIFPEADRRALFAQIERARKDLGKSFGQALRFAGYSLARTLGTSTRVAPKRREVVPLPTRRGGSRWGAAAGTKPFAIIRDRGSRTTARTVYAKSIGEVRRSAEARVRNYGLAKASWMWGVKALGGPGARFGDASPKARVNSAKLMAVRKSLSGADPFIEIRNRLGYIREALTGGSRAMDSALGRAASMMAHIIDANVAKNLGAK